MKRFAQGKFELKHPEKYIGLGLPRYRSSWEWAVMRMCDNNSSITKWASESIQIPYRDPLTGKYTIYVPDFFINFVDKTGKQHAELWEVKPENQALRERVGKNKINQAHYIRNMAKWEAANAWCRQKGLRFRVLSENDIFHKHK